MRRAARTGVGPTARPTRRGSRRRRCRQVRAGARRSASGHVRSTRNGQLQHTLRPLPCPLRSRRLGRNRRGARRVSSSAIALGARGRLRGPLLRVSRGGRLRLRRGNPEERLARRFDGARGPRAEGGRDRLRVRRAARLGRDEARGRDGRADRERRRGRRRPSQARAVELPRRYELERVTLDVPGLDKRRCSSAPRPPRTRSTRAS